MESKKCPNTKFFIQIWLKSHYFNLNFVFYTMCTSPYGKYQSFVCINKISCHIRLSVTSAADVKIEILVLVQSLKSSILSSTSFQMDQTFSGVVSAAVEQLALGADPRIPPNRPLPNCIASISANRRSLKRISKLQICERAPRAEEEIQCCQCMLM